MDIINNIYCRIVSLKTRFIQTYHIGDLLSIKLQEERRRRKKMFFPPKINLLEYFEVV